MPIICTSLKNFKFPSIPSIMGKQSLLKERNSLHKRREIEFEKYRINK